MVEFVYVQHIVHSSTQPTPLFANHVFHPKFDIQGVHNIVIAMWLANIWAQLVSNLEDTQKRYKEMLMSIIRINQISRSKTKFYFNNTLKQLGIWRNWTTKHLVHSSSWNKSMLWPSNSSFQTPWRSIQCFMFPYWNLIMHPWSHDGFQNHLHQ